MKLKNLIKKAKRWLYRNSITGRFMSKQDFEKADPKTTEKEARR